MPIDELPGTLSSDMRTAFERGYQYGIEHHDFFKTEYIKAEDLIKILKAHFPTQTTYVRHVLFAVFFYGLSTALKERTTEDVPLRYRATQAKMGSLCLLHLTEFYRRITVNRSRHLFYTMCPKHKASSPREWEIYCSGALGVALIIQAINRQGWSVYHPTPYEDVTCKIDLFAIDPSCEFGLCLQIKTRKNGIVSLIMEHPDPNQTSHGTFLSGVRKFTPLHPDVQWIPLFVTISLPNLAIDPQAIHPAIEDVIRETLAFYILEEET